MKRRAPPPLPPAGTSKLDERERSRLAGWVHPSWGGNFGKPPRDPKPLRLDAPTNDRPPERPA